MKLIKKLTAVFLAAAAAAGVSACSAASSSGNAGEITFAEGDKIAEITIEDYGVIKAKLFPDIAPNGVENFEKLCAEGYYDGLKIHRVVADLCVQGGSLNGDGTGGAPAINDGMPFANETSLDARNFYGALCYVNSGVGNSTQFYIVNCKKTQDLSQYDAGKMKAKADELAAQMEELEEDDPSRDDIKAEIDFYTNLAEMFEKATDDVKAKYAVTGGYPFWDGGYTVFGQVFEGLEVLDKISAVDVTTNNTGELSRPKTDIIIESIKIVSYTAPEPEPEQKDNKKKK